MSAKILLPILLLCFLPLCLGYTQQIVLYDNVNESRSNFFTFRQHIPDLTTCYTHPAVICTTGFWIGYPNKEFEGPGMNLHGQNDSANCFIVTTAEFRSLRHGGHFETTTDGISLYPEEGYQGKETLVTRDASGLLSAKSFLYTGKSEWMLYEQQDFQGKVICTKFDVDYHQLGVWGHFNVTQTLGLDQVGSVIRGCSHVRKERIIEEYRAERDSVD